METKEKLFIKYLIATTIVAFENVLFLNNEIIGKVFVSIEVLILLYLFFYKKVVDYTIYFVIFVSNCMEFSSLAGSDNLYNIKTIHIGPINVAALLLLPIFFKVFSKPLKLGKIHKSFPHFHSMGKYWIIMNIVAIIVGLVGIIINDNGISNLDGVLTLYIERIYSIAFIPTTVYFAFLYILGYESEHIHKISIGLQATLIGPIFQTVFSIIFKRLGQYGSIEILLIPTFAIYAPILLLTFIDNTTVYPIKTMIIGAIGTSLILLFNSSGKFIIIVALVLCILVWNLLKHKNIYIKTLSIILILASILSIPIIVDKLLNNSVLFASKFGQVIGLFDVSNENWISKMPPSPRFRVEEIINTFIEYINKPWFILTGKGFLGSIKDYTGFFTEFRATGGGSAAFSELQWNHGIFYNLHEFCDNLLIYGIMGLVFLIMLIAKGCKSIHSNVWLFAGILWFITAYDYSFTMASFGAVALFYGLCNYSKNSYNKVQIK